MTDSPAAAPDNRRIRVFVSSTFRDMQAERDALLVYTWPALRRLCRDRQVEFVEVDLRWGISEEQSTRKETLKLCLDEIRACRPFFIALLGERYGWVPGPDAFTADLEEEQPWLHALRDRSVTELEILHGVLNNPEMADRAFFYFRDPAYAQGRGSDFLAESPAAAARQAALKERIRATCAVRKIPLREGYPDPQRLAALVLADLQAAIEAQYPAESIPDPLTREARDQEAFAESRRRVYIGRPDYYEALDVHALGEGGPLVVLGESGSGKSALLANWLHHWRQAHGGDFVFQHYIGATPGSADHWGLLYRLLAEIKHWTGDPAELPVSHDDMLRDLGLWLARLRTKAQRDAVRALIVLDALNQLEDRDGARLLGWLPDAPFTGPLRLVVSTLPGDTLDAVERRGWQGLRVQPFTEGERGRMIVAYLAHFGKRLDAPRVARLAAAPAAANPLYLKTLLDELRVTGTHERLDERLADYLAAGDIPALLEKLLARYERDYERDRPGLVREALALLWAARRGLSEPELLALLCAPDQPQLPPALWAPLRAALDESLVDRGGILSFAHGFLRAAVERRFAPDAEAVGAWRLRLADYFAAQPATVRSCDELPWLLWQLQARDRLRACLLDIDRFLEIRERDQQELLGYWLWLDEIEPLGPCYLAAYEAWLQGAGAKADLKHVAYVANQLGYFVHHCAHYAISETFYRHSLEARRQAFGPEHPYTLTSVNSVAVLLYHRGDYAGAEALYRQALEARERTLGPEHPDTLLSLSDLGVLLESKGEYAESEALCRRTLAVRERLLGPEHPDTLISMSNLAVLLRDRGDYAGAEALHRQVLERRERTLGPEHPDTLNTVNNLAVVLENEGDYTGAEALHRRALAACERTLGPDHPDTLRSLSNLAMLLKHRGDYAQAEALCRRALEARERTLGPEHPDTLYNISGLASLRMDQGDSAGAEPLYRRALEGQERILGPEHRETLSSLSELVRLLKDKGDYAGAEPLSRRLLEVRELLLGPEHPDTLSSLNLLATLLQNLGDYAQAEPLFRRVLEARERTLGPEHPHTLTSMNNLALLLYYRGNYAEAEPLYRRALAGSERLLGPEHSETLTQMNNLALLLHRKGDDAAAEALHRQVLERRERVLGPEHPNTLASVNNLAALLDDRGDDAEAEALYRRALEARERVLGPEHPDTLTSMNNLALLLDTKGDYAEAEPLYRRALERQERLLGSGHPDTLASMSNLASLLYRRGYYVEAEPLLRRALEERERLLGPEHPDALASANNLAAVLRAQGDLAGAELLYRRTLEARERVLGPQHPDTLISANNLATLLESQGDQARAEALYQRALEGLVRVSAAAGSLHASLRTVVENYVALLRSTGRPDPEIRERLQQLGLQVDLSLRG